MAKTQEELTKLKTEYETLSSKLKELNEDELKQVIGGNDIPGLEAIGPTPLFSSASGNVENDRTMRDAKITEIGEQRN